MPQGVVGIQSGIAPGALRSKLRVFLGSHGVMVVGNTVAEAFDELYYLERVAQLHVYAMSTGRPLMLIPDDVAELTCKQWLAYPEGADLHLQAVMGILDEEEPAYRS